MDYFVLYNMADMPIAYFDNISEVSLKLGYPIKELNRKFRNSVGGFVLLVLHNTLYMLFSFTDEVVA